MNGNSKMKKAFREWPFYILLFPLFFILHGVVENPGLVTAGSALNLGLIYLAVFICMTAIFRLMLGNLLKAALITGFIMSFQLFFGALREFVDSIFPGSFFTRFMFLIPAFLVVLVIVFIYLRRKKSFENVTSYLNVLFIVLVGIELIGLVTMRRGKEPDAKEMNLLVHCDTCAKPDIYLIVVDEYAGEDELKDLFNFDNQEFFAELSERGFTVFPSSHSNYNYTPYSTASLLQMEYLDSNHTADVKEGYKEALRITNGSKLTNFLESEGYEIFNHSYFPVARKVPPIDGSLVPTNAKLISDGTFTSRLHEDLLVNLAGKYNVDWYLKPSLYATRNENEQLLGLTKELITQPSLSPRFVYTHLLMPHFPYYRNEEGKEYTFTELKSISIDDKHSYLSYLKYVNREVLSLIDSIDASSPNPAVIALVSDHGFRQSKDAAGTPYAFSNLLCLRVPGIQIEPVRGISNVNFFRIMLNAQFGQRMQMLGNRTKAVSF